MVLLRAASFSSRGRPLRVECFDARGRPRRLKPAAHEVALSRRIAPVAWALLTPLISAAQAQDPVQGRQPGAEHPPPDRPYCGLAVQIHRSQDPVAAYGPLIRELPGLGADTLLLSVNAYQEDIDSSVLAFTGKHLPTDDQWLELFRIAHQAGLRVVLMPKVLLSNPRAGAWRGKIAPTSWDVWFDQYRRFILHFAELAEKGGAEVFMVGSELISTEKFTPRWRSIIADVRKVYTGRIGYSANWDHYKNIQFWDDLDLVGLTTYYNLNQSDKRDPTPGDLIAAWEPIRDEILKWCRRIDRPLLFTEVGWCSQEGASTQPWNYYHNENATPAGHREQAANYRAFLEVWGDYLSSDPQDRVAADRRVGRSPPEVAGILWWEWTNAPGGERDYGYTPRGKPAERVLREFFASRKTDAKP